MSVSDLIADEPAAPAHHPHRQSPRAAVLSAVTAAGIVYGDIGTSPLYAFQVALGTTGHAVPQRADILGLVSLIFWAIIFVVAIKYVIVVMRADNEGEGGILALLSLATSGIRSEKTGLSFIIVLGIAGAAFIYGDGVITPAISVLSAMEGLDVAAPSLERWILALTVAILVGLFAIQSRGTTLIGRWFGPIMVIWFVTIAILGLAAIVETPAILAAANPVYALQFLLGGGKTVFVAIGAVFLAVTGAEALYADMGHVGASAIRRAWFALVLPALSLSYFGQGALVLAHPEAASNPFFNLPPAWAALPMVVLAAVATIIASQALISGAFSLTRQAIQMRLVPRMEIVSTSGEHRGQIYLGAVNWGLMIGSIAVVIAFKTSAHLAAAYGIAVSGTMLVTSILLFHVVRNRWGWPLVPSILLIGLFAVVDLVFLGANVTKIVEGGWFPLVVGAALAFMMIAWRSGTIAVQHRLEDMSVPFPEFLESLDRNLVARIPGCAVIVTRVADYTSPILVQQVRHNRVLHEHVVLLTLQMVGRPSVSARDRLEVADLGHGIFHVTAKVGFMQTPDIPTYVKGCVRLGLEFCHQEIHYFLAYEHVARRQRRPRFPLLLWWPYSLMSKHAVRLADFLRLSEKQVLEIGIKVQI